jgi:hypothetical protein
MVDVARAFPVGTWVRRREDYPTAPNCSLGRVVEIPRGEYEVLVEVGRPCHPVDRVGYFIVELERVTPTEEQVTEWMLQELSR